MALRSYYLQPAPSSLQCPQLHFSSVHSQLRSKNSVSDILCVSSREEKKIALHLLKSQNLKGFSSYILKLFIYLFLFLFEREQIESALLSFMV